MNGTPQEVRSAQTVGLMAGIGGSLQTTSGAAEPLVGNATHRSRDNTLGSFRNRCFVEPPASGKSRIAREALSSPASRGCEIRWAIGTSSARGRLLWVLSLLGQSRTSPTVYSWCAAGGSTRVLAEQTAAVDPSRLGKSIGVSQL